MEPLRTYAERLLSIIPVAKQWRRSVFYRSKLDSLESALDANPSRQAYFSLQGLTLDGNPLLPATEVRVAATQMDATTFVYLFSVFNGSACFSEETDQIGHDGAPPGSYIRVSNSHVIGQGHDNRIGLYLDRGRTDLAINALHIDHIFLAPQARGASLGAIMFSLCAIAAFSVGVDRISLLAAGGRGFNSIYYGYKMWPRYGFDAPLNEQERSVPKFSKCHSVQDLRAVDAAWWEQNGNQREMEFDLRPHSRSWKIMLAYMSNKV